mmetsp:Transcript_91489/g.258360  ORF Transcript_91489/g.258360 Transcript_91489/m.258360 type:complete len:259 (+) Transcript_91489:94-870(+)
MFCKTLSRALSSAAGITRQKQKEYPSMTRSPCSSLHSSASEVFTRLPFTSTRCSSSSHTDMVTVMSSLFMIEAMLSQMPKPVSLILSCSPHPIVTSTPFLRKYVSEPISAGSECTFTKCGVDFSSPRVLAMSPAVSPMFASALSRFCFKSAWTSISEAFLYFSSIFLSVWSSSMSMSPFFLSTSISDLRLAMMSAFEPPTVFFDAMALVLIFFTLLAKSSVTTVSSILLIAGDKATIITVFELPPRESCNTSVILEPR